MSFRLALTFSALVVPALIGGGGFVRIDDVRSELPRAQKASPASPKADGSRRAASAERLSVTELRPDVPAAFSLPAVSRGTLFPDGFRIVVPQGATRLQITLRTSTANADVDVYVRHGAPVDIRGDELLADHAGDSESGDETVVITAGSNPPLRAGEYHMSLALFTTNTEVSGTILASVSTGTGSAGQPGTTQAPPEVGTLLTPDVAVGISWPAVERPTLFGGEYSFRVRVPAGMRRFRVRMAPANKSTRIVIFARAGREVELQQGEIIADVIEAESDTLQITRTAAASEREEVYYIAYGVMTPNTPVKAQMRVTFDALSELSELQQDQAVAFTLDPVPGPTLMRPLGRFEVKPGATKLEIRMVTETPDADVDVFVTRNRTAEIRNGVVLADYIANGTGAEDAITVEPGSGPALAPGWYALHLGTITPGTRITGTVTISVR